ncbi:MAG: ABC transporter permease [Azonexus sp.]
MLLREAIPRLFEHRAAWLWLVVEPVFHVAFLAAAFHVMQVRSVGGIDSVGWLMVGLVAFFLFSRTAVQAKNAVHMSRALYAYRQVLPIDTVLARGVLELFLMTGIAVLLFSGAILLEFVAMPVDPLRLMAAWLGLWLAGMGYGLIASVLTELSRELGNILQLVMTPLYFVSGVFLHLATLPQPYRGILLLNPLTHGLEAARLGFVPNYHATQDLDLSYLYGFSLICIFIGLLLQRRFAYKLRAL